MDLRKTTVKRGKKSFGNTLMKKHKKQFHTTNHSERGILDFFIVCDRILPHVDKMLIDEKGELALTKYRGGETCQNGP